MFGISGFGGVGSIAASGAGAGAGSGAAATVGFVGVTSGFFGTLAAAFFAAGRLRLFALLRTAALAFRVAAAFLPAVRRLRVVAAFRAAALRFRVAAAFFPALFRLGLMSFPPLRDGIRPELRPLCKTCLLAIWGRALWRETNFVRCDSQRWRYRDSREARRFTSSCDPLS